MDSKEKIKFITNWIGDYVKKMPRSAKSLVIGVSGGIDSSVSSTLCAMIVLAIESSQLVMISHSI